MSVQKLLKQQLLLIKERDGDGAMPTVSTKRFFKLRKLDPHLWKLKLHFVKLGNIRIVPAET